MTPEQLKLADAMAAHHRNSNGKFIFSFSKAYRDMIVIALRATPDARVKEALERILVGQYMVDTTMTNDSKSPVSDLSEVGAPEIEITSQMIEAGELVLSQNFFNLCDGQQYPLIARTVFAAMVEARRRP